MNKYFLLPTTQDRIEMAAKTIESVNQFFPSWHIVVVAQGYSESDKQALDGKIKGPRSIVPLAQRIGAHRARRIGLKRIYELEGDSNFIVCTIDDDLIFIPQTNFDKCIEMALLPFVGLVSAGWVNSETRVKAKTIIDTFQKQIIVYTGGGLLFDRKVADVVYNMPNEDYFSDNTEWSLAVYMAGYENCRYKGSVTIHKVCMRGGRRDYVALSKKKMSNPAHILITPGNERFSKSNVNNFLIGTSEGVTELAKQIHRQNKKGA